MCEKTTKLPNYKFDKIIISETNGNVNGETAKDLLSYVDNKTLIL